MSARQIRRFRESLSSKRRQTRSGLWRPGGLGGIRATPERSRIDAVGIESEHTIIKFLGGRRFVVKPYEVLNVTARFLDVPRRIIGIEGAVPDNDRPGVECFDFVNGGEPIVKAFSIGLHEIGMRAVVDGVAPGAASSLTKRPRIN
jgi:hypothetical protein